MNWNWNQERVDQFMHHISTGFVPPSPLELALQLSALFAVIFAYAFLYRRIQTRRRESRVAHSESRFVEACHELRLPPGDRALLRRLAEYLPRPEEELHTLLREREVFQAALDALLHSEYRESEAAIQARPFTALGVRLGFKARSSGRIVRSTADLPPDTLLFAASNAEDADVQENRNDSDRSRPDADADDESALFRVREVHPGHLDVAVLRPLPPNWKSRRTIELSFRRREGHYTFATQIIAVDSQSGEADASRAVLAHNQGRVRRRQNRRHFRRDTRFPARFGNSQGYTLNLSGGGALLELNSALPTADSRPGDVFDLALELDSRNTVRCPARIIVMQDAGRRVQVEFVRLRDADRDRIIKTLFGEEGRSARDAGDTNDDTGPGTGAFTQAIAVTLCWSLTAIVAAGLAGGAPLHAQPPASVQRNASAPGGDNLGDYYYRREKFDLARVEYERGLRRLPELPNDATKTANPADPKVRSSLELRSKLGLSLMREHKFRESLRYLNDRKDFRHLYLGMFAAFRSGWAFQGLTAQSRILDGADFSDSQKDQARLLGGTVYLESGEYERVRSYYSNLQREAVDDQVRVMSGRLLTSLDAYESLDRKNAWLAAGFSTLLPGAGQVYAGHTVDGVTAFFFNTMFLGSAAIMYDLENRSDSPHIGSGIFGVIGLVFYLANVSGAYQTAHRYNAFQERRFHQDIRDAFFHLDYIEKNSGVVFQTDF